MGSSSTVYSIQMLRAIAAALVVLTHGYIYLFVRGHIPKSTVFVGFGDVGVGIFFVVSGFIMVYVGNLQFQKVGVAKDFILRRMMRIIPMYWLYTIVLASLLIAFPQHFSENKSFDFGNFLASLFFVPLGNGGVRGNPILPPGWTLNFEMYFYATFAILLMFPAKFFLPSLAIFLTSSVIVGNLFSNDTALLSVATSPLILEFLLGSTIGICYLRSLPITRKIAAGLFIAGVMGLALGFSGQLDGLGQPASRIEDLEKLIKWGLPVSLIVAGVVFSERNGMIPVFPWLVKLGDSSYSVYLTHIFTINALGMLWVKMFNGYYSIFIALSFVCSILAGHTAFLLLEQPLTNYLKSQYTQYKHMRNHSEESRLLSWFDQK